MARTVILIGRDESGSFIDPISGKALECVCEGEAISALLEKRLALRDAGCVKTGKKEVKLSEIRTLSNHTAGGELKPVIKF